MGLETGAEPPVEYGVFQSGLGGEAEMANRTDLYDYLKGCQNQDILLFSKATPSYFGPRRGRCLA